MYTDLKGDRTKKMRQPSFTNTRISSMVSICFSHIHWCSCLNIARCLFWSCPYSIIYYHTLKIIHDINVREVVSLDNFKISHKTAYVCFNYLFLHMYLWFQFWIHWHVIFTFCLDFCPSIQSFPQAYIVALFDKNHVLTSKGSIWYFYVAQSGLNQAAKVEAKPEWAAI